MNTLKKRIIGLIALVCMPFGVSQAHAAVWSNQFVQFELPPQWQCTLEQSEWICQNTVETKKRDGIIVLAAKIRGDQDSLENYHAHLKLQKNFTSVQGKPVKSEVKYTKQAEINQQTWIDSLQQDSEIPGFYTRYLATVIQDIGVLVTYSIHVDKYQEYLKDFETLAGTLKVFRKPGGINVRPADASLFKPVLSQPGGISESTVFPNVPAAAKPKTDGGNDDLWLYILVGLAVVGFIIIKRRRG
jgi:hypothetical protein